MLRFFRYSRHGKREKVEHINWGNEFKKSLLTSFVFLIAITICTWSVRHFSRGEYTGKQLNQYFLQQVSHYVGIPINKGNFSIQKKTSFKCSEDSSDGVVVCGEYSEDLASAGVCRFLFIFEREDENLWNALVGTKPKYTVRFASVCRKGVSSEILMCDKIVVEDYDENGLNEIGILFSSIYGDRIAHTLIVLQNNNGWTMLSPDFSDLEASIREQGASAAYPLSECYSFEMLGKEHSETIEIYGQTHNGFVYVLNNPFWGGRDFLYRFAVNDGNSPFQFPHNSVYIMKRFTDHGLFTEPNWNFGQILYVDDNDFEVSNLEALEQYWGNALGGGVAFFGFDVE